MISKNGEREEPLQKFAGGEVQKRVREWYASLLPISRLIEPLFAAFWKQFTKKL